MPHRKPRETLPGTSPDDETTEGRERLRYDAQVRMRQLLKQLLELVRELARHERAG